MAPSEIFVREIDGIVQIEQTAFSMVYA